MRFLLIISLYLLAPFAIAQKYQLSTYDIDEGLTSGLMKDIITDEIGFVWSATDQGIIRFDGIKATLFDEELPGGFAKAFYKTKEGKFLILHDFGLTEIISRSDTVYFQPLLAGDDTDADSTLFYAKSIYEDSHGNLWMGENGALVRYRGDTIKKYRFSSDFAISFVRSFALVEDGWNNLWSISYNGNLSYYEPEHDLWVPVNLDLQITEVGDLTRVNDSTLWVGAQNGLFQITVDHQRQLREVKQINGVANISTTLVVSKQQILLGTWDHGLYNATIVGDSVSIQRIDILPFTDIVGIHYDGNNGFWIAGSENTALLKPVFFDVINLKEDDSDQMIAVEALDCTIDSTIIAGTGAGIYLLNKQESTWSVTKEISPNGKFPTSVLEDGHRIWVGDFSGELWFLDSISGPMEKVKEVEGSGSNSAIREIFKDSQGNIWICGSRVHGTIRIDTLGKLHYYNQGALRKSRSIGETKSGVVYCVGGDALSYIMFYDKALDLWTDLSVPLKFPTSDDFTVEDFTFDLSGNLLLATTDGLLKYQPKPNLENELRIERLDLGRIPIDERVIAVAQESSGETWVATDQGLVLFNDGASLLFDRFSGLPSDNLTPGGLVLDHEDNLWVATKRGVAHFKRNWSENPVTPTPVFLSINTNGTQQRVSIAEPVFNHNAYIEFEYTSLSFPSDKINYQTRLLQVDSTWSSSQAQSKTILSSLDPGDYTFQVRALQHGGLLWSLPVTYKFKIEAPWFTRWWSFLLFAGALLGVVSASVRLYNWNLIKQNERLESIIKERTKQVNQQKNEIIQQQNEIIEKNEAYRMLQKKQLTDEIDFKNKELTTHTLNIIQKNQSLKELRSKMIQVMRNTKKETSSELRSLLGLIDFSFKQDKDWDEFKMYFEQVHTRFFEKLTKEHHELTPYDLRHCALIRLNLSISETATILGISPESVKTSRFRLRKKLKLETQTEVMDYLMSI